MWEKVSMAFSGWAFNWDRKIWVGPRFKISSSEHVSYKVGSAFQILSLHAFLLKTHVLRFCFYTLVTAFWLFFLSLLLMARTFFPTYSSGLLATCPSHLSLLSFSFSSIKVTYCTLLCFLHYLFC